jgi:hypothetical protein
MGYKKITRKKHVVKPASVAEIVDALMPTREEKAQVYRSMSKIRSMSKTKARKSKKPGARWRLQAYSAKRCKGRTFYRDRFDIENQGIFDELVIDDWFHIEQMDDRCWWVRLGQNTTFVKIDRKGRAKVMPWEDNK